jgi:uncharacterized membrane protein YhaH (DUF805 family)
MMQLLFSFNGRIRRTNYWLGALGAGIGLMVIFFIIMFMVGGVGVLAAGASGGGESAGQAAGAGIGIVGVLLLIAYFVLAIWISLALQIKRWHDRDKSGVWVFISLIPFVGAIWVLVECGFLDGTPGPNKYGPSPKGVTGPAPVAT